VLGDGQLLGIGQPLLGLDHERKTHRFLPLLPIFPVDKMVHLSSIVRMSRTISPGERSALVDAIVGQFRASVGELRCVASERLVRQGVSMGHLHLMSMLDRHGELPMSRIAELLDVSDSNATGLIDRMEERGFVERLRRPDDRRVVLVRVSERGRQILTDIEVVRDDLMRRVLARLDDGQLDRLGRAVEDINGAVLAVARDEPDLFSHTHAHSHTPSPAVLAGTAVAAAPTQGRDS
jgi:DNA-binding MarR family transcriptional regulator